MTHDLKKIKIVKINKKIFKETCFCVCLFFSHLPFVHCVSFYTTVTLVMKNLYFWMRFLLWGQSILYVVKAVRDGWIWSSYLFTLHAKHITWKTGLDRRKMSENVVFIIFCCLLFFPVLLSLLKKPAFLWCAWSRTASVLSFLSPVMF